MSVLDLSGADTSGFDPIPSNKYHVRIHKIEMDATKGSPTAKNPPGTPMVKIQLKVVDGEYKDKTVFDQFVLPNKDAENADKTLGFFVRFLVAFGADEKKLKSKGFNLTDLQDFIGKEAIATVAKKEATVNDEGAEVYPASNQVKGYKDLSSAGTSATSLI